MQRQCAWCLRLMDTIGEPISPIPVPKIYKATHGMCKECGTLWLEQAVQDTEPHVMARTLVLDAHISRHY
jgi:hypothetical protein